MREFRPNWLYLSQITTNPLAQRKWRRMYVPNGRNGLEKLVPSRGRSHLIAPVADAKQCNTMTTKLERTSLSGQVYFRTKFGNTSLSAQCKHRQSQMPLFGIQIFLSEAEVGTIYYR